MPKQNNPLKDTSPAGEIYARAVESLKARDFEQAKKLLEESIALQPSVRAWHDLGVLHFKDKKLSDAVTAFQAALEIDPAWHQSLANLYRIMAQIGSRSEAMRYCALAINHAPEILSYHEDFIRIGQNFGAVPYDPIYKKAIQHIFENYNYNHQEIGGMWYSIIRSDSSFKPLRALFDIEDYPAFKEAFSVLIDPAPFLDPYLHVGLRHLLTGDRRFEKFIRNLRRALLEGGDDIFLQSPLPLIAAVAEFCYLSEYVMSVTPEEEEKVSLIRKRLEESPGKKDTARSLCVLGCYEALSGLKNAAQLGEKFKDHEEIKDLVNVQIIVPLRAQRLRETIPSLSPISDAVSVAVREQYEEFPYPRWKSLSKMYAQEYVARDVFGEAHSVLNAGCGTGRHMLSYAVHLPQAEILAVDLSLASLSYAKNEAEARGIKNVSFMQADILELEKLGRRFDLIQTTGVLHHMADPMQGWHVLRRMLNPGGLMRMALYSDIARRHFVAAQRLIAAKGYTNDVAGIRKFRDEAHVVLQDENYQGIMLALDFFSLSQCRDLLFHVQEMRFDMPMLKRALEELDLEFLGFAIPAEVANKFKAAFPGKELKDFDAWHEFEKDNPKTFLGMYQFWCRARD